MATKPQIKLIRTLLAKQGISDPTDKEQIISLHTDGRTTHITDMTNQEINSFVNIYSEHGAATDRMVRKILSLCHEMLWETKDGKVDMTAVDKFCKERTPPHVPLDKIKTHELPTVVTIFERVHADFMKNL